MFLHCFPDYNLEAGLEVQQPRHKPALTLDARYISGKLTHWATTPAPGPVSMPILGPVFWEQDKQNRVHMLQLRAEGGSE